MKTTKNFYDEICETYEVSSAYAVAKIVDVKPNTALRWKKNASTFDEDISVRVAKLLDYDPAYVLACMAAQKSEEKESYSYWTKIAGMLESGKKTTARLAL